tara:strand:- start:508 stop:1539 length:1032 start_codon:yes stop_codon:yes gene_type:complete
MNILLTGCKGYIGSVLTDELKKEGFFIKGLDTNYYSDCLLYEYEEDYEFIKKDIRDINKEDLTDIDAVIHLAALSNDPLGEFNPKLTEEINLKSTINLAKLSKESGVKRFIYISSQSMYGISNTDEELDEENSAKNPITSYAKTKWEAECFLKEYSSENFTVVCFRPSTVFGASPRLRCDIVFNNFVACAYTTGLIEIKSDGSPWRPVIHIKDVCNAILAGLIAPTNIIKSKSFNIGIKNGNFSVRNLAEAASESVEGTKLVFTGEHGKDSRTYKVSFKRILNDLEPWYKPLWTLEKGAKELIELFKKVDFSEEDFRGPKTNRLIQLKKLSNSENLDKNLRWL